MRDIIRLSITLAIVGILSASLLTAVYNVTEPIIVQRQEEEYRQALEEYFPGFDHFETENIEDDYFDLVYDQSGELMGIMSTILQPGYEGNIIYNLAVDSDGEILGLIVVSHSETPGIGDVITTDSFKGQFIGKTYEDSIAAGEDVDIITGATISTVAMINSVRRVMNVIAGNYLGVDTASNELVISAVADGIYEGSAPGIGGLITVAVEVAGGKITAIEVLDHSETPTYFIESYPLIPDQIIDTQGFDIDTETGATVSAEGIINAVRDALEGALEDEDGGDND